MADFKVVIVMSTYNGEKFLPDQLDSFIAQEYQNWRLIVHDDGSTDSTMQVLSDYAAKDNRIRVLENDGHLGIKRSFLSLLGQEEGDFYAFSDQDDVWHANKLSVLVTRMKQEDPVVPTLIYSRFVEINGQGEQLPGSPHKPIYSTALKDLLLINTVTGCTCMLNRALRECLLKRLSDLDLDQIHMHDWWAALVAAALGQVIFVDAQLVSYRQHKTNVLGAPGNDGFATRLGRFMKFRESRIVSSGSRQAGQLLALYGSHLRAMDRPLVAGVASLFKGWAPIRKIRFLKTQQLYIHSKFLNIELTLLLWMTPWDRARVFAHNA
ncbi:glycosyltransferase family 2 protein [Lacticaseibacillus paracasei]|uniref:glycosyltransferase family 2 protein n=1 Tax=Lacticaseibacillus paracasei TaxID=1597 RepID=UPI0021A57BC9|nr:glycosyltransferase family 2 protein [Lacticaseibacillus paracasei]MCT4384164.1 glycosyltransferase family 2 protein [Lacticaseibacillus paracasei]